MASQGRKPVKITSSPLQNHPGRIVGYTGLAGLMVFFSRRAFVEPGSFLYETLIKTPEAAVTAAKVQDYGFILMVVAHAVEVPLFAATRLRKHGVPFFSVLWWKWALACFAGGLFTWNHLARDVADAEAKRA